jgi:MHS family citrate/tricarballylate:H+ symporter-like MFS transporter
MFMIVLGSCIFYFIFTFMPVFVKESLGMTTADGLLATVIGIGYTVIMGPVFAVLSDKIGRFPILAVSALLVIFTAYPVLQYLIHHPGYGTLIVTQLWFSTLYSAYSSSSFVGLSEIVPPSVRATGYGVSTTLGLALFGGCTPLISAWLIHVTGDDIAPSLWLVFVAVCSLIASCILFKGKIAIRGAVLYG